MDRFADGELDAFRSSGADLDPGVLSVRPAGMSGSGRFSFALREYTDGSSGEISVGESVTFVALEHGRARIRNDHTWLELEARQCGLYISNEVVEVSRTTGQSTRISSCSIPRSTSTILGDACGTASVLHEPTSDRIETLFQLGHNLSGVSSPSQLRLRDMIGEAILQSFIVESGYISDNTVPPFVRRTRSYFDEHFSEPCDLTSLASGAGVRKEHLVSAFRRHVGTTPIRYLWDLRTRHAVQLVRTTQMTLAEIANVSGYKSHFHLSREIKRLTGLTPRELRRGY